MTLSLRRRSTGTWARALAVALVFAAPAGSEPPPAETPEPRSTRGTQVWGLSVGHGLGLDVGGSSGSDVGDVEFVALVPHFGLFLTDHVGAEAWYGGSLELLVEGALLYAYEPQDGFAGGASLGLRWNFLAGRSFVPFVEVGAGMVGLDFDLEDQADGLNFILQGGIGLHYLLSPRTALTGQWRFHHISNAGLRDDNDGINDSLFLVGLTYFR